LNLLNQEYKDQEKGFNNTIEDSQKRIDIKYQTMAERFASYDNVISSYNVQSQTIKQSIAAMVNSK